MKNNIKYRGVNSYALSGGKINSYKFIKVCILFVLMIVTIFSTIRFKLSQKITNTRYINESSNVYNEEVSIANATTNMSNEKNIEVNLNVRLDSDKMEFLQKVAEGAIENYYKYGILPSITIAQAILESGWGQSDLAVTHNNLFGIKADLRWNGAVATIVTNENYNDSTVANFRKYDSINESIEEHGNFLYENSRYDEYGLFDANDYRAQAQALEDAGYSTVKNENGEPIYADKLISLIEKYNLMQYD